MEGPDATFGRRSQGRWLPAAFLSISLVFLTAAAGLAQLPDPAQRLVPRIPPKGVRIPVIFDSDAKNEIDDQWALALALLRPDRFDIRGFVATTYGDPPRANAVELSALEIELILQKAGVSGRWPVKRGSARMRDMVTSSPSEGVDFIIERAMAATPENPLWIVGLGAATNLASAYLKEPRIKDRIVAFWHFRTKWPDRCENFNVFGDRNAARVVFHSAMSFVLFDTGTDLTCPMRESEANVRPYGELGRYLHEYRLTSAYFQQANKGFFDLGDIAALVDPEAARWEVTPCPTVRADLVYDFTKPQGAILRCFAIDRDRTFALLYAALKAENGRIPTGLFPMARGASGKAENRALPILFTVDGRLKTQASAYPRHPAYGTGTQALLPSGP